MTTNNIDKLTSWKSSETVDTLKKHKLDKLLAKAGVGASAEDLFGEVPKTFVHTAT